MVLGDVHRRWEELAAAIDQADLQGRTIVQVGDFGLGFGDEADERRRLEELGAALAARSTTLLVVRGNHDNPACYQTARTVGRGRIRVIPDYTVEEIDGQRTLFVGGAVSVDRKLRRTGRSHWTDEGVVLDLERLATLDIDNLALVVTHTAPTMAPPILNRHGRTMRGPLPEPPPRLHAAISRLYARDSTLAADVVAERRALDRLYEALRRRTAVPQWVYGHFHHHATYTYQGTRFTMLRELQLVDLSVSGDRGTGVSPLSL